MPRLNARSRVCGLYRSIGLFNCLFPSLQGKFLSQVAIRPEVLASHQTNAFRRIIGLDVVDWQAEWTDRVRAAGRSKVRLIRLVTEETGPPVFTNRQHHYRRTFSNSNHWHTCMTKAKSLQSERWSPVHASVRNTCRNAWRRQAASGESLLAGYVFLTSACRMLVRGVADLTPARDRNGSGPVP